MPTQPYYIEPDEVLGRTKTRIPSVTTILGVYDKPALVYWANEMGREGLTVREAQQQPKGVGTVVHAMIEADVRGQPLPLIDALPEEYQRQAGRAFDNWLEWRSRYKFKAKAPECSLVSNHLRFGGTMDLAFTDGRTSLIDYKTSKDVYEEYYTQIAAYGHLWNTHHPDDPIARYHILCVDKDDAHFKHVSLDADSEYVRRGWRRFLIARLAYHDAKAAKAHSRVKLAKWAKDVSFALSQAYEAEGLAT